MGVFHMFDMWAGNQQVSDTMLATVRNVTHHEHPKLGGLELWVAGRLLRGVVRLLCVDVLLQLRDGKGQCLACVVNLVHNQNALACGRAWTVFKLLAICWHNRHDRESEWLGSGLVMVVPLS